MSYKPLPLDITDAIGVIEKLTMTQHPTWRPDYIEINSQYFLLGYGVRTSGRGTATRLGYVSFGTSTFNTRVAQERLYYQQIHRIVLQSWTRKLKQWYVVSIQNSDDERLGHILRTKNLEDAKHFVDAMEAVVAVYRKNPEMGLDIPEETESNNADDTEGTQDVYTELIKLEDLRERGILTDAEFDAEKKKLLEGN